MEHRRDYIAVSLDNLQKNEAIFNQFQQVVSGMNIKIDKGLLSKIHMRMAKYAFRAYTKQKNNAEFNKVKELASDATNLSFRTVIHTRGRTARRSWGRRSPSLTRTSC